MLPRLYAIVDRATLDARRLGVREFAEQLRDAGVRLVQYRDKAGAPQEVLRAAAEISTVFARVDATLVMNDRADLAALAGWGVHLGQADLSPTDSRKLLPAYSSRQMPRDAWATPSEAWSTPVVGVSTHTEEQVIAADSSIADYVAVGPVFGTSTKLDAEAVVGLDGVRRARELTRKPLVAIGGITLENCRSVVEAGADSVAVIGGMFVAGMSVRQVAEDFLARLR